jgi:hypothetical protein
MESDSRATPRDRSTKQEPGTGSPLPTILTLFLVLHLTVLILFTPQGLLNAYTDFHHYFRTALYSEQGYLPYRNMWYEYPPISAYLVQGAYAIVRMVMPVGDVFSFTYQVFARLLGMLLLVFEAGVLVLVYLIGELVWGKEKAAWLGWVYALLSLPFFYSMYSHQVVAGFFFFLAIYAWLHGRAMGAAASIGLGVAAKLTPVILFGPLVRFAWPDWKRITGMIGITFLVIMLVYLPFIAQGGGEYVFASFSALTKVGSYGTVWAMVDGNWGPGEYGPLETRLDLAQATVRQVNPPLIPDLLLLVLFGLLYAYFFFRPLDTQNPRHFIWFTTLTVLIFHLWSKGWSPQWGVMVVPLFLLASPGKRGLTWVLLLTLITVIEWPLAGVLGIRLFSALAILARTLLFVWILLVVVRLLWPRRVIESGV